MHRSEKPQPMAAPPMEEVSEGGAYLSLIEINMHWSKCNLDHLDTHPTSALET
jgi:hypothetical protein